jgi:D-aminopeptidase
MRTRDLGITIGRGRPGPGNAITDVPGVRVGQTTLIEGDGPLVRGRGPIRTGVTLVVARGPGDELEPVFAGCHVLNGNGELTGLEWVRESGMLTSPMAITNTHSVGVVRDALVAAAVDAAGQGPRSEAWSLPVVGETYDGLLNDMNGFHVRAEHVVAALAAATGGPVAEGGVGGGTGSVCHEFKGGIGTASRVTDEAMGGWTVGVVVQANYGRREWLRIDGVPVGESLPLSEVPSPYRPEDEDGVPDTAPRPGRAPRPPSGPAPGSGSIIVIVATDAPLLPHQCERLAQRAGLGIARMGGTGSNSSGDLFLAFATGNDALPHTSFAEDPRTTVDVRAVNDHVIGGLFDGVIEATEEAIVNALVAAETMTGRDGITAHAIPHDRLVAIMAAHGRGPRTEFRE